MSDGAPPVPAHVAPYVRALGLDRAVDFLLAFGGAPMSFSMRERQRSRALDLVGLDGVQALQREVGRATRVPLAKQWIAQYLHTARGLGIHDIARRMHASDVSVAAWVRGQKPKSGKTPIGNQLTLL
ncbi:MULTISPECIES: hypothetical protein [unclassified Xanthobacter]|uniref:hypothetical protein n=1 Tax=unclassified Xanthobacter TaxID=2623496 RepID=UPI001EDFCFB5|nr:MULTISPECIES: hypothetical protein [unclassified Xanthobacter]